MIKYKNKETNNGFIQVKCISKDTYNLLKSIEKQGFIIDNLIKYSKGVTCNSNINDIYKSLFNEDTDTLINIFHIKIMADITKIKCIKFDTFYFFKAILVDSQNVTYFLTNDKIFIEKYIKK